MTPKQAALAAIEALGGPVNAARLLLPPGGKYQTIQSWLKSQVPSDYCPAVERETVAVGKPVRCEDLRPDVDWSVLRTPAKRKPAKVEG